MHGFRDPEQRFLQLHVSAEVLGALGLRGLWVSRLFRGLLLGVFGALSVLAFVWGLTAAWSDPWQLLPKE